MAKLALSCMMETGSSGSPISAMLCGAVSRAVPPIQRPTRSPSSSSLANDTLSLSPIARTAATKLATPVDRAAMRRFASSHVVFASSAA